MRNVALFVLWSGVSKRTFRSFFLCLLLWEVVRFLKQASGLVATLVANPPAMLFLLQRSCFRNIVCGLIRMLSTVKNIEVNRFQLRSIYLFLIKRNIQQNDSKIFKRENALILMLHLSIHLEF